MTVEIIDLTPPNEDSPEVVRRWMLNVNLAISQLESVSLGPLMYNDDGTIVLNDDGLQGRVAL